MDKSLSRVKVILMRLSKAKVCHSKVNRAQHLFDLGLAEKVELLGKVEVARLQHLLKQLFKELEKGRGDSFGILGVS